MNIKDPKIDAILTKSIDINSHSTTNMTTKTTEYRNLVDKFVGVYGQEKLDKLKGKLIIFNVTGGYRDWVYGDQPLRDLLVLSVFLVCVTCFVSVYVAVGGIVSLMIKNFVVSGMFFNEEPATTFDGGFVDLEGQQIGIFIPTQGQEGDAESENFREIKDKDRLLTKLTEKKIPYEPENIVTCSMGSTSLQVIDGRELAPFCEFEMGIESWTDEQIDRFLLSFGKTLNCDGILAFLNSVGYGLRVDAGIVYNDNKMEVDTITENVVSRTIGGTGDNSSAMKCVRRLVSRHKALECNYILAFVPRGDKTMPQGGSHSKNLLLKRFREGVNVVVIEVSGKQTKMFELDETTCSKDDSADHICKQIKETKLTDGDGKSHGSKRVFG